MKAKELIYRKVVKNNLRKEEYHIELKLKKGCNNEMMFTFGVNTYRIAGNGRRVWQSWTHDEKLVERYVKGSSVVSKLDCCDLNGNPLYAVANGMYHINNDNETGIKYLRLNDDEECRKLKMAAKTNDKNYFAYMLDKLGITKRWKDEADEAVRFLEQLTGYEFEMQDGLHYYMNDLSEDEKKEVERKIAEGLYTEEAIEEAHMKKLMAEKQKKIDELKERFDKDVRHLKKELEIKLYFISNDIEGDMPIYYSHIDEVAFNWGTCCSAKPWTQEMFDAFMARTDKPAGVKYVLEPIATK